MILEFENSEHYFSCIESVFTSDVEGITTSYIFYYSPWDKQSMSMVKYIGENFKDTKHRFFLVNIFECPEAYNSFRPKRIPSLFISSDSLKEQYITAMIWRTLETLAKKSKKQKVSND